LARDGVVAIHPPAAALNKLREAFEPMNQELARTLDGIKARGERIKFSHTQIVLCQGGKPVPGMEEQGNLVLKTVADWSIAEIGQAYYPGCRVEVNAVGFRRNVESQDFYTNVFKDDGVEDPKTSGMHIDSNSATCLNGIIYLNEVTPDQGPFHFVPGSNHWEFDPEDRAIRKAIDETGSGTPRGRAMFMTLPAEFRHKAGFGFDLLDGTPESDELLSLETKFTSDKGQLLLFDSDGVHRGGNVRKGHRTSILITMTVKPN
jgi:ectoine hydroxylase-related dioxygenase (phytanoyl-CoA dioxygenase family)